jgi:hypothetical protein
MPSERMSRTTGRWLQQPDVALQRAAPERHPRWRTPNDSHRSPTLPRPAYQTLVNSLPEELLAWFQLPVQLPSSKAWRRPKLQS